MNKIFNTTFESSLRILSLLSVSEDEQMTLDRIADYDFILQFTVSILASAIWHCMERMSSVLVNLLHEEE